MGRLSKRQLSGRNKYMKNNENTVNEEPEQNVPNSGQKTLFELKLYYLEMDQK